MKLLIIGMGGNGSYTLKNICDLIDKEQIGFDDDILITIADNDIVELEQIKYQNFNVEQAGMPKTQALKQEYSDYGVEEIRERITTPKELEEFDVIILCVDNETTRKMVIEYCHKNDKEFLDLRANGSRIFAMPKEKTLQENLKFVDSKDMKEYSCQDKSDLEKGRIQLGNRIIAIIGTQMLLNIWRGYNNRIISMVV